MRFDLEERSGYLEKFSGISYADAQASVPNIYVGGSLYMGQRWWETIKPLPAQHYRIWRAYLSFDTTPAAGRTVRSASLWIKASANYADTPFHLRARSGGSDPFGEELTEADWNACDGELYTAGVPDTSSRIFALMVGRSIINTAGRTQFRLRSEKDILFAPTGNEYLILNGADSDDGCYLMVDTGNINDDFIERIVEVLTPYKAQLEVTNIHDKGLVYAQNPPEIQVQWGGTMTGDEDQDLVANIYYIDRVIPAGDPTAAIHGQDERTRKKLDLIRRILRHEQHLGGFCLGPPQTKEDLAIISNLAGQAFMEGGRLTATYRRTVSQGDFTPVGP